jgi:hypothetical protein
VPETEPTAKLNEGFSEPGAAARPWTEVAEVLSETEMFWLSNMRRNGRPYAAAGDLVGQDAALLRRVA